MFFSSPSTTSNKQELKYDVSTNIASYSKPTYIGVRSSGTNSTYTTRSTGADKNDVEISVVSGDKIKVRTDEDVAYAQPAQCNVDIVLAIPTNGAACNRYNRDAASDTAGSPYYEALMSSISSNIAETPLYQMGQALKNFVKNNFYHTRGVYMSLIPYSGKLSISHDRTAWTTAIPPFVDSTSSQVLIGAVLYGTSGVKDAALKQSYKTTAMVSGDTLPTTDTPYYWGGVLTGCPIMCRRGAQSTEKRYGNNYVAKGDLTSVSNPTSSADYKYRRMNLNSCYGGYANMLSMRCERKCTHFLPNPYYVIEPTADLVKIYEMCNALYPFYDTKNVSNFVFLPLEWARNFFQTWTNNPSVSITTGTGDSAVLSRPSKTTSGRKKAIILLVNKPDWFEPGELTYLGFDNDASEIPMTESDKIDFSINYSSSQKFLDGTAYDGTIAEPKKILRIERVRGSNLTYNNGFYEANGTYRLKFPRKGLVKLKVAQPKTYTGTVIFYTDNIGDTYDVRKDSTSGTSISLGTAQTVTGSQTFVFSGGSMPTAGKSLFSGYGSTKGANFSHNLCVKKVRYSLSNATITDIILKNQIIRSYVGLYGQGSTDKVLILTNGAMAVKNDAYLPYNTYNSISKGSITLGSQNDIYISRFQDSCIKIQNSYYYKSPSYASGYQAYNNYLTMYVYGIKPSFKYVSESGWGSGYWFEYYTTSGYVTGDAKSAHDCWGNVGTFSHNSAYNDYALLRTKVSSSGIALSQFYFNNSSIEKTLQSTTPITSNPITYQNLIENKGIYLANYGGENWICFQGDGELHVTVQEKTNNSKWWYQQSNGSNSSQQTITGTSQTITIPSSAFKEDHGRYIATVYFRNAYVKSLTQQAGKSTLNTIESTICPSSSYPLVYSYEKPDGSVTTTYATSMTWDSSKSKYYLDLPPFAIAKYAAIKFSKTEAVDDLIEFYSSTSNKNGKLTMPTSFSGSNSNYFYTISSSRTGRLALSDKGILELTVAPKMDVSSGTIRFGSGTTETIEGQRTFKIETSNMTSNGSIYYVDVTCNNLILIKAKYYYLSLRYGTHSNFGLEELLNDLG